MIFVTILPKRCFDLGIDLADGKREASLGPKTNNRLPEVCYLSLSLRQLLRRMTFMHYNNKYLDFRVVFVHWVLKITNQ